MGIMFCCGPEPVPDAAAAAAADNAAPSPARDDEDVDDESRSPATERGTWLLPPKEKKKTPDR